MTIAIIGTPFATGTSGAIVLPQTGTNTGDYALFYLVSFDDPTVTVTPPAGVTQIFLQRFTDGPHTLSMFVFQQFDLGSHSLGGTFARSNGNFCNASVQTFRGVDTTTPLDPGVNAALFAGDSTANVTSAGVVTTYSAGAVCIWAQAYSGSALTLPAGYSSVVAADSNKYQTAFQAVSTPTNTGPITFSGPGAGNDWATWTISLVELGATPPASGGISVAGIHYVTA